MSREFIRRQEVVGTAAAWAAFNPVLMKGEWGLEEDTGLAKFGDGETRYSDLQYVNQVGEVVGDASQLTGTAPLAVIPDDVKTTNGARPVGKGELVVNVADYASFADAVAAASSAATFGPATVYVPPGTFPVAATVTIPAGVTVRGEGPTSVLQATAAMTRMIDTPVSGSGIVVKGVTLDGNGNASTDILRLNTSVSNSRISAVAFKDTGVALRAIGTTATGGSGVSIKGNRFDGAATAIQLSGSATDWTVSGNRITGWSQRGIFIHGTASARCDGLRIEDNVITNLTPGGSSRYPIRVEGVASNRHTDVKVTGNTVVGPGTSHTDPVNPGTADQISMNGVNGLTVVGNTSIKGGDAGITVESCSRVTLTANRCELADSTGLFMGAVSSGPSAVAAVTGNVFVNCGQNRQGNVTLARAGIRATATNATFAGNTFVDDQATPTMLYGVSMTDCDNVTLGPDVTSGVGTVYFSESGNTNLRQVTTQAL